jgi:hypothetical protein
MLIISDMEGGGPGAADGVDGKMAIRWWSC